VAPPTRRHGIVKDFDARALGFLFYQDKGIVNDARCNALLAALHQIIDEFGHHLAVITRIRGDRAQISTISTHMYLTPLLTYPTGEYRWLAAP
jgi:hypothetical protein